MEVDHEEVEVTPEMVEIRVSSKEGFNASHEGNHFIVLNTTLTSELINEGIVREFISKVQNLRKTKDFEITDRIIQGGVKLGGIQIRNSDDLNLKEGEQVLRIGKSKYFKIILK